jgi:hypothetical protein
MGYLILPLIIGIISTPTPPSPALNDFTRIRRALNQEVYLRDNSGQERVVSVLGVGADAVTVEVGRQWMTINRDAVLAVDRLRDGNTDGVIKGALIGLILGSAIESAMSDGNGRYLLRGAVTYGALGYLFDRQNVARQKLYRAP